MAQSATNNVKRPNWLVDTLQTWILLQTTKKRMSLPKDFTNQWQFAAAGQQ